MSADKVPFPPRSQSKNPLEEIVRHVPGVVYQYQFWPESRRHCFPYASEGIREIYGVSPEDVREDADAVIRSIHPDDLSRVWQSILDSAHSLQPWRCEYRVILDGRIEWLEGYSTPTPQDDGSILWHGFITNITERKRRDLELQLYSDALRATQDAVSITDRDGIICYVNRAFTELTGYGSAEAIGHTSSLLKSGQQTPEFYENLWRTVLAGKVWKGDIVNRRKNGFVYCASATISPILQADGECSGFVETQRDVTEIRLAQAEIAGQKAHLSAFVEHAPVAIAMFDNDMRYIAASKRWLTDYELERRDIIGLSHYEVFPDMSQEWRDIHSRCLAGAAEHREDDSWTPPGWDHPQYLRWEVRPWHLPDNSIGGIVMLTEDITPRKVMEEELRAATARAEQTARIKAEFLANMSHEIRTPLNAIVGMSEILGDNPVPERAGEYVETIRSSTEALLILINDILDFSKIDSGQMELERIPVHLRGCVEAVLSLVRSQASDKHIELSCTIGNDLPETILGDPSRLRQVLANLLNNAIKFTLEGTVTLSLRRVSLPGGDLLHVSVRDTGIGIPENRLDRLFQTFSQVDASTTRRFGGTGLGLAISHRIVTLMGGRIWVDSQLGKGSDFQFEIPLREAPAPAASSAPVQPFEIVANECPLRILVAEDNPVNQRVITLLLQRLGYQPRIVFNGIEVLDATDHSSYDVLFLDIQMPEMDGMQTARELNRRLPRAQRPWIIALTADAVDGDREQCLAAGMDDYLSKPVRTQQLADALRAAYAAIRP